MICYREQGMSKENARINSLGRLVFCLIAILLVVRPTLASDLLSPEQIAQKTYDRYVGEDMQMLGRMELIDKNGSVRIREFVSLRKDFDGLRKQLIRFTAPADIAGTAFLNIEKVNADDTEQHLYLPALKRTRRIVASQMSRSFVNSDFTYEDMHRHSVAEWQYALDGIEIIGEHDCYILVSTPKQKTDTQYGRTISWIGKDNFIPLKVFFFDNRDRHIKTYLVSSLKIVDGIATEMDVSMEDIVSGDRTRLVTLEAKYNTGLPNSYFTTRALEKQR